MTREYRCQGCGAVERCDHAWPRRLYWCERCEAAYDLQSRRDAGPVGLDMLVSLIALGVVTGAVAAIGLPMAVAVGGGIATMFGVLIKRSARARRRYFAMRRGAHELPPASVRSLPPPD